MEDGRMDSTTKVTYSVKHKPSYSAESSLSGKLLPSFGNLNGYVNGAGSDDSELVAADSSHYANNPDSVIVNGLEDGLSNLRITEEVMEKDGVEVGDKYVWGGTVCNCTDDDAVVDDIVYLPYESERQMTDIMKLIQKDLSEPYSIYTYRYFIYNWPNLCFLAMSEERTVGAIVCKLDFHRKAIRRGYIAMLAVDENFRKRGIGSSLVLKAIRSMVADGADEVVLETEITNDPALRLYENLGFVRDKRLFRYYLNGVDALRLKLWLK